MPITQMTNLSLATDNDPDYIYYNIQVNGNNAETIAKYDVNRVTPVLQNPSEYDMAIIRFRVPTTLIPLFLFKEDYYKCSLVLDGPNGEIIYTEPVEFLANSDHIQQDTVWNISEFIHMLNVTYAKIFEKLKAENPLLTPANSPPVWTYDPITDLFSLEVQQEYVNANNQIKIYINNALHNLFPSFENMFLQLDTPLEYQLVVRNRADQNIGTLNNKPSYIMLQDTPTSYKFWDINRLIFKTSSIPVVRELDGSQTDVTSSILTDFNITSGTKKDGTSIIYFPQGPLRYTSMASKYPVKRIDLQVFYETGDGSQYPVVLAGEESFSVKLQFRKKTTDKLREFIQDEIDYVLE